MVFFFLMIVKHHSYILARLTISLSDHHHHHEMNTPLPLLLSLPLLLIVCWQHVSGGGVMVRSMKREGKGDLLVVTRTHTFPFSTFPFQLTDLFDTLRKPHSFFPPFKCFVRWYYLPTCDDRTIPVLFSIIEVSYISKINYLQTLNCRYIYSNLLWIENFLSYRSHSSALEYLFYYLFKFLLPSYKKPVITQFLRIWRTKTTA